MKQANEPGISLLMALAFMIVLMFSCAGGNYVRTAGTGAAEVTGTYTLILFGGNFSNDPRLFAVLDREGDAYTFKPFARKDDYILAKNVPAAAALAESQAFVRRHSFVLSHQLKKIHDREGTAIGFEMRPIFHTQKFGVRDIIDARYRLQGNEVIVSVDVDRKIREFFYNKDSYQ